MSLFRPRALSVFRKAALGLWNQGGDPSVYGFLEVDVSHIKNLKSPLSLVIKGVAEVMRKNPDLNSILRFGRLYHRPKVSISIMVQIARDTKQGLSFSTLQDVDKMTVAQIETHISGSAQRIRRHEDPHFGFIFRVLRLLPQSLIRFSLSLYSYVVHDLKWNLSFLKFPNEPFGSVIISNIGSFGLKKALLPLVPMTRAAMLISVGAIGDEVKVIDGQMQIRQILHLGVTFDHRLFDGEQVAKMNHDFLEFMNQPQVI